jgi:nitroreductase
MTHVIEAIKERRSIRSYKQDQIKEETISLLLEAIKWSPSWANTQCWEVILVRDPEIKKELQQTLPKGNPARDAILKAPVLFVMCAQLKKAGYYKGSAPTKFGDWFMFDLGIATQSLCLAAHSLGLGSVIVGLFDHDKAKQILRVPEGYEVVAIVPVGYPEKIPSAPKRRETKEFVHYERF